MLRVQARPSSGDSEPDLDSAGEGVCCRRKTHGRESARAHLRSPPVFSSSYIARDDLAKLQRDFRVREGSRKAYAEQAQSVIRKQQAMIEALERENADLQKNLSLAGSRQNELKVSDMEQRNIDTYT